MPLESGLSMVVRDGIDTSICGFSALLCHLSYLTSSEMVGDPIRISTA